ncbi:MAG: hypothetical protein JSS83_15605 [Cyanobacteria bacterium SZAS LIN-3]|nr:hypothetical protein [Cyanobacteria bacterium SZAS LIN-3]
MSVITFKPRLSQAVHGLYMMVQETFNRAGQVLLQGQAASTAVEAPAGAAAFDAIEATAAAMEQRVQLLARIKYDAQVVERDAVTLGQALVRRRGEFPSDCSFLLRQQHTLDAELVAIEAQLLCAGHLADAAERKGLERPQAEIQYLSEKAARKQTQADELQALIVSMQVQPAVVEPVLVDGVV